MASVGLDKCDTWTVMTPQVYQRSYVYDAPRKVNYFRRPHYIPEPKSGYNVVFVRLPEDDLGPEPIIVPPPRQQQVVYVLNKQSEQDQRVIEVPAPPPTEPEVVFVDYEEGENPILPSGEDLHSALTTASRGVGHVVESGGVGGGINSFGSGHALTNSIGSGFESDFGVAITLLPGAITPPLQAITLLRAIILYHCKLVDTPSSLTTP
ncbi:uncharacterized protein LOC122242428 [Penaeus japonicus]|uniref:uncharacterized protein LOC122242428 n=1 Tax=Penaeus japonicus TaxID=27405 RepID=UPI001C711A63|nr:uncharacterized protein LOC122242428 [Penaeus japonicus]